MRALLSLVVVVHLLVMAGSALRDLPVGPPLRELTRPIEQLLGIHQTWPMFGVPPRASVTLHMVGLLDGGDEVELPPLDDEPSTDQRILRYQRRNKLMRNATSTKRKYLRAALVRWQCRRAKAQGLPLRQIRMERITSRTPPPRSSRGPRETWPRKVEVLEHWNCKR